MRINILDDESLGVETGVAIVALIKTFGGKKTVRDVCLEATNLPAHRGEDRIPLKIVLENRGVEFRIRAFNMICSKSLINLLIFCEVPLSEEVIGKILEGKECYDRWYAIEH